MDEVAVRERVRKPGAKAALAPFVVMLAVLLGAGMVGQLALTTALQSQGSAADSLRQQSQDLGNRLSDLQAQVAETGSMTSLAAKAAALGMKPNPYPVQVELPTGRVLGKPTTVTGYEVSGDGYHTPEQLAAQRAAADDAARKAQDAAQAKAQAEADAKAAADAKAKAAADAKAQAATSATAPPHTTTTTKEGNA